MLRARVVIWIVRGIVMIGVGLAVIGVMAPSGYNARIYGFWQPQSAGSVFGPFVNRNHFAGWMLMTIPLGVSYLWSLIARETAARSWRARLSWLSTPSASGLILLGMALAVMVLSVVMTLSRSGIGCLVVGLATLVCVGGRARVGWWRRAILAACVAGVVAACVGWAGQDRIGGRFAEFQTDSSGGRVGVWRDAGTVARAFPLTGTGFNTFSVAMLFYQTHNLEEFYAEAHSDYLQIGAEGGLLVGIPALALILVTGREVRRQFSDDDLRAHSLRVGAVAGLLTIALQETVEFSLQMPGNAALFCVLAAIALHHPDRHRAGSLQLRPAA
jgi:O-antigen ligase